MIKDLFKTQIGRLRILAYSEGVSFLLLLMVTVPLKYIMGLRELNIIIGLLHGLLFMAYVVAVIQIKLDQNWTPKKTFLALLAALIPFGTFWADWKLFR